MTPKNQERIDALKEHLTETYNGKDTYHEYQLVHQFVRGMKEADANAIEWVKKRIWKFYHSQLRTSEEYAFCKQLVEDIEDAQKGEVKV